MKLAERNFPLWIGLILSLAFIFLAVAGPALAPRNPMDSTRFIRIEGEMITSPYRPMTVPGFPLGSDEIGRDLLSRIMYAVRPTLLMAILVVLVRVSVGAVLGLSAGWYRGRWERGVDALTGACLAIPMLVFAVAAISYFGQDKLLMTFVTALSLTGWAETAAFIKTRTLTIVQAPYIEGARAIGAKPGRILLHYILPQLWPVLPAMIAFELAAVMLLVAELGFLGIFIGGGIVYDVPDPNSASSFFITTSGQPELGQLLADFWAKIIRTPWVPFLVGSVVFIQILAYNLLGEGLRRYLDVTRPRR